MTNFDTGSGHPMNEVTCLRRKRIDRWTGTAQLQNDGFIGETRGPQGAISFGSEDGSGFVSLGLGRTPGFAGEYVASRIKEIGGSLSAHDRDTWWQAGISEYIRAEFVVRFEKTDPLPGLTETLMLWNAPFGSSPIPLTAVGVTRSLASQGRYAAIVAQDVVTQPRLTGLLQIAPMPEWLAIDRWHNVRLTVSRVVARVEVAQGQKTYSHILEVAFPHPPEPLAFEFSLDNEVVPGKYGPVAVPDRLDIGRFDMGLYRQT